MPSGRHLPTQVTKIVGEYVDIKCASEKQFLAMDGAAGDRLRAVCMPSGAFDVPSAAERPKCKAR